MIVNKDLALVIVDNSKNCRIINNSKINNHIVLLKNLRHFKNKFKDMDLTSVQQKQANSSSSAQDLRPVHTVENFRFLSCEK